MFPTPHIIKPMKFNNIFIRTSSFNFLSKNIVIFSFIFVLCLVTYSNSLTNDFLIDDHDLILNNIKFQHPKFLLDEPSF